MTHRLEPLADQPLDGFSSGQADLDSWLHGHARSATGQGTRTYVLVDEPGRVVGYVAIAPHLLDRDAAPRAIGRGAPRQIAAVLLAKLALDTTLHGQGIGSELLVRALELIVDAARRAGGRVVVVDAIDDSGKRFYEHHDFRPLPDDDHRLVMKLSTAAKTLGVDWP